MMLIEPIIEGVIARNAHPYGCEQSILQQIHNVKSAPPIQHGPKRVLILGASSGFGLAARIALTFGGANAKTIGVSLDSPPAENKTGNASFYNNFFFKKYAQQAGHTAINIQGDVFAQSTKDQVVEAIETYFDGEVDLIIYSIASGKRLNPENNVFWHATIKPIGQTITYPCIDFGTNRGKNTTLTPASENEITATLKVMGGEPWEDWIDTLINSESIAQGCQSIAFSYVGSPLTYPIYLDGTLGRAKIDLHQTSHALNIKLAAYNGGAYAVVCQALMTRASVMIPGLFPYLMALHQVMSRQGVHETCGEQMQRLFTEQLYSTSAIPVDGERLIRLDHQELSPLIQKDTQVQLAGIHLKDPMQHASYQQLKVDFMQLNGFGWDIIDYHQPVDIQPFIALANDNLC